VGDRFWQRLWKGVRRWQQHAAWPHFAGPDWAEHIMQVAVTDRLHVKQGRSIGRLVLHAGDERLVVYLKRHYRLSSWRGLLALLWPNGRWSPALQEWDHLQWARRRGLPMPVPLAGGECIGPWGRLQSFLATEELTGMLPLHQAVPLAAARLNPAAFAHWKRGLIAEMVRLTRDLHDRRRFHKDLYLCHFYIPEVDTWVVPRWRGHVFMIDLHRLAHHPWTWRWWQAKDLGQLLYSSEVAGVTARDRLRFWRAYQGDKPQGPGTAWLRWCVQLRWRSYQRHGRKRKQARERKAA
jgi:heptose I phosphotransferase